MMKSASILVLLVSTTLVLAVQYKAYLCDGNCCPCATELDDAETKLTKNGKKVTLNIHPVFGTCLPNGRDMEFL